MPRRRRRKVAATEAQPTRYAPIIGKRYELDLNKVLPYLQTVEPAKLQGIHERAMARLVELGLEPDPTKAKVVPMPPSHTASSGNLLRFLRGVVASQADQLQAVEAVCRQRLELAGLL